MMGYGRFFTCRSCLMGPATANSWSRLMLCKCINLKLPNEL